MRRAKSKFKCKVCGYFGKEMFNCSLSFMEIAVDLPLCRRCLKRLGWKRPKQEEDIGDKVDGYNIRKE